jgi:hypothetical protein
MVRASVVVVVALSLLGAARPARAQSDFVGVRALGMGESQRATATGASGPLLNPAGMSLLRQYVIEGMYTFNVEQLGHIAHLSVVDSVTSRVAAGLFYTYIHAQPKLGFNWAGGHLDSATLTRTGHATGLSLSVPLGDRFILGATVKYLHFDTTAPLPAGTIPKELTFDTVNGITFDVGLLLRLGEKFNLTTVAYNLWDHGSRESPLSLGLALAVIPIRTLTISFDAVMNFTGYKTMKIDPATSKVTLEGRVTGRLGPGIEWLIGNRVPVRLGVTYDSGLPATYFTVGVGYVSSSFGIDLGYRAKVQGGIENVIGLGVRLFVN